jgi:hypothetical protein
MTRQITEQNMPDELSLEESDNYDWIGIGYASYEKAKKVADEKGGIVYTQVDTDRKPHYVAYVKGWAFVNRTGWYIVIRKTRGGIA